MATLLYGDSIAERMRKNLQRRTFSKQPKLAVIQVGENTVSKKYIAAKQQACQEIGAEFELFMFPKRISNKKLSEELQSIVRNKKNTGVVVQLPLPPHIRQREILDAIPPEKDVDLLSAKTFGMFALGQSTVLPPTVHAIATLLRHYKIDLRSKRITVVGAGRLVGLPVALWLIQQKATVTVATEKTENFDGTVKQADIIITGVGKRNLITAETVKHGSVVIDAGTSVEHGQSAGDVDFNEVVRKARYITPVPGGVGPLTVACLLENLVTLTEPQA